MYLPVIELHVPRDMFIFLSTLGRAPDRMPHRRRAGPPGPLERRTEGLSSGYWPSRWNAGSCNATERPGHSDCIDNTCPGMPQVFCGLLEAAQECHRCPVAFSMECPRTSVAFTTRHCSVRSRPRLPRMEISLVTSPTGSGANTLAIHGTLIGAARRAPDELRQIKHVFFGGPRARRA